MRLLRPSAICGILGLALFVAGFFLPAVRFPPDPRPEAQWGPGVMNHEFPGYLCAEITLVGIASFVRRPTAETTLTALTGLINPLVMLYLVTYSVKRLNRARPWIAGAIVGCCLAMWVQLAAEHVTLLVGHCLWIAGIAVLLFSPLVNQHLQRNASKR